MTPPSPTRNWILSIDFGSTSSVVVAADPSGTTSVIEVDGERSVPSVVFVDDDGTVVVGKSAVHLGHVRPSRSVRSPKRRLGNRSPIVIAGAAFSSVTMSAEIIRYAANEAIRQQGGRPSEVRLTYPAMWGSGLRSRLIDAAHEAGLESVRLIPEPIAAAFAAPSAPGDGEQIAIYDLGGGTFDTAVVRAIGGRFEVVGRPLGTDGVGGELLDEIIMSQVGARLDPEVWERLQVGETSEWAQAGMQLLSECRRVKEAVSSHPYAELRVGTPSGVVHERVTRAEIEAMVAPHLEETIELLRSVSADLDLASIQLVGGGSRMPLVQEMVTDAFPAVTVNTAGDPRVTVALGGAAAPEDRGATRNEGVVVGATVAEHLGAPSSNEGLPAAAGLARPATLEPADPPVKRALTKVVAGAFVAVLLVVAGSMMVYAMVAGDGPEDAIETAEGPSLESTTQSVDGTDSVADEVADDDIAAEDAVGDAAETDDENGDSTPETSPDPASDSIGPFVTEVGSNINQDGTYVVTTSDLDACVEGDLALRNDETGVVGPTITTTSITSEIVEGPQGVVALVERCDGRFARLRLGSQLSGELDPATLDDVILSPSPTRLELLSFDFIRQVPIGHAQFADSGDSWFEVQIGFEGDVVVVGPSGDQPKIELSSEGLTLVDQLSGQVIETITYGTDSRTVLDLITPLRAGPGETVGAAGCIDEYLVAQMDGITLTFLPDGRFAGWFLRPDVGGPALATASGLTLGSTVAEIEVSGGRFLLDPAESGVGGFNVQIGDDATGTAGLLQGFVLDDTSESELLELMSGQNCAALVASD